MSHGCDTARNKQGNDWNRLRLARPDPDSPARVRSRQPPHVTPRQAKHGTQNEGGSSRRLCECEFDSGLMASKRLLPNSPEVLQDQAALEQSGPGFPIAKMPSQRKVANVGHSLQISNSNGATLAKEFSCLSSGPWTDSGDRVRASTRRSQHKTSAPMRHIVANLRSEDAAPFSLGGWVGMHFFGGPRFPFVPHLSLEGFLQHTSRGVSCPPNQPHCFLPCQSRWLGSES